MLPLKFMFHKYYFIIIIIHRKPTPAHIIELTDSEHMDIIGELMDGMSDGDALGCLFVKAASGGSGPCPYMS